MDLISTFSMGRQIGIESSKTQDEEDEFYGYLMDILCDEES